MVLEVAVTVARLQWSKPNLPQPPSFSQALASAISSPSLPRRCLSDGALILKTVQRVNRSALFGSNPTSIQRSRSREKPRSGTLRRACSATLDSFSDEEFSKKIQELALIFQLLDNDGTTTSRSNGNDLDSEREQETESVSVSVSDSVAESLGLDEQSSWVERGEQIESSSIERKANSVDLPVSLRMIKRKIQWQEGFREAGETAYCSVKKAFSSMVFIIRELHSYTLQMRELLYYEDLQGILVRVQKEMHASFVWLFQQVFSHTPTLMVYVMILLANYSVHSMGSNVALAAAAAANPTSGTYVSMVDDQDQKHSKFDSSSIKSFSVSSSSGKTASIGGNNGGGGKVRPVASGTEGDGWFEKADQFSTIVPNGASQLSSPGTTGETRRDSTLDRVTREDELTLWNSMVDEASKMLASVYETLDHDIVQRFVSPVTAKIEPDGEYEDYFRTELLYQTGLLQEPNNALLLANYAQFLYFVAHDYDRAEEYFKKAIGVEAVDAEAYSKYASFLWRARNDLCAAEETFLEALSADPSNSYHAANYAHFLWNTGGEDTCFPLDSPDTFEESRKL
ncbi:zinc finger family protein [Hibiscus syriacus]|uniref:Zinc finger family protein n=1 Tax=Hibiscus syriacus TaxID=106335 RepID=A0A6A3CCU9_HIBSY|nr:uncharacterized protein LOC120202313 [Hibiscus syriacus]KAE8725551.1 zinc finger family protein [Hibiscus syriacus]